MKNYKKMGLVTMLATAAVACLGPTPASATTMDGGAFTLTSGFTAWTFPGYYTISCINSTISGTTPAGTATTVSVPVTLGYSGCSWPGGPAAITPSEGCHTAATSPRLDIMQNQAAAPQASVQITLPVGCNIDVVAGVCTMSIAGGQTIGNGTSGAGGIGWTNLAPRSYAHLNGAPAVVHSSGGGFLCPPAGSTTAASATASFQVTSATNVTVTP
jgi:hypothetical protein